MAILSGTTLNDTLTGATSLDTLFGLSGDDAIAGLGSDDLLDGGNGNDSLEGGAGSDGLYGKDGSDSLSGGAEADNLFGGAAADVLDGGDGNDLLDGSHGDDQLLASNGNDNLFGDYGNDSLDGGTGNDSLDGGAGNDNLYDTAGNNSLIGGAGSDTLVSFDGKDILSGGAGNDELTSLAGDDNLDGGDGNDELYGGDNNDILLGGVGSDSLDGATGKDFLVGDTGSDRLVGGEDDDNLNGGSGNDTLIGVDQSAVSPGIGEVDILRGGLGRDIFILADAAQTFYNNDAKPGTAGKFDFAHIADFNVAKDKIQLGPGSYFLGSSPIPEIGGTGIFLDEDVDELIAVVDRVYGLNLGSPYFSFATTPKLAFSTPNFSVVENGTPIAEVKVTRTGNNVEAVSATMTLTDGTATAVDYKRNPILVTFGAEDTDTKTVIIPLREDRLAEGPETINLSLGSPTGGAVIGEQQDAILTIIDNDSYRITDLGDPLDEGDTVNNQGQVIAGGKTRNNQGQSVEGQFLDNQDGTVEDLGTLPGPFGDDYTNAKAINNNGQIVGDSGGNAFLWSKPTGITDIGADPYSSANDINEQGQIAGSSGTPGSGYDAFLYNPGEGITTIDAPGVYNDANGINDKGQLVGESYDINGEGAMHAFLYSDGIVQDLNNLISPSSGWTLETAIDLSNNGHIVGNGSLNGETHGFLLTPVV